MKINSSLIKSIYNIDTEIDYSEMIKNSNDIIEIKPCYVKGSFERVNDLLVTNLDIDVKLVLASTRTLKPVDYHLIFNLDLIFGESEDSDFALTPIIDLDEIIFGHIILEKPQVIYNEGEKEFEKEKETNHVFDALKDFKF
jgi:uncharacterized metal-binding protein YceD (DUF177 family)